MSGLVDLWLAARKGFAEWRARRLNERAAAWTRTARDCLSRMRPRPGAPTSQKDD